MGQVDPRFCRGTPVLTERNITNGLSGFIRQGVMFTGQGIELWMAGKAGFKRAIEIRTCNAFQFVGQFDGQAASFDNGV
ncbi:hypothetical protein A0J51_03257 [Gluconobacter japonicus]|nr:hypothetical protein A0J51_03257 [Gluconobacter japonicus]